MDPRALKRYFLDFVDEHGVALQRAPASAGFACMLGFYADVRATGCDIEHDGDMLLFQWGTCDRGSGLRFEVDLTRQVLLPDAVDDDAILQLHLTYSYAPSDVLGALGKGDRWCASLVELPAFEAFVTASPALVAATALQGRCTVELEHAG